MFKCVICNRRYRRGSPTTFHRFPTDDRVKLIWLKNLKVKDGWKPRQYDVVCSHHFAKDSFKHYNKRTLLKMGCVPTIANPSSPCRDTSINADLIKLTSENNAISKNLIPIPTYEDRCNQVKSVSNVKYDHQYGKNNQLIKILPKSHITNNCISAIMIPVAAENLKPIQVNENKSTQNDSTISNKIISILSDDWFRNIRYSPTCDDRLRKLIALSNVQHDHTYENMHKSFEKSLLKSNIKQKSNLKEKMSNVKEKANILVEEMSSIEQMSNIEEIISLNDKSSVNENRNKPPTVKAMLELKRNNKKQANLRKCQARVKAMSKRIERLTQKVASMKSNLAEFKKKAQASEDWLNMLSEFDDFNIDLLNRMLMSAQNVRHNQYTSQLKDFATTLYSYSPAAYMYVRKKINFALPHPRVLRFWRSAANVGQEKVSNTTVESHPDETCEKFESDETITDNNISENIYSNIDNSETTHDQEYSTDLLESMETNEGESISGRTTNKSCTPEDSKIDTIKYSKRSKRRLVKVLESHEGKCVNVSAQMAYHINIVEDADKNMEISEINNEGCKIVNNENVGGDIEGNIVFKNVDCTELANCVFQYN